MRLLGQAIVMGLALLLPSSQAAEKPTLELVKAEAAARSKYLSTDLRPPSNVALTSDLKGFQKTIAPILIGGVSQHLHSLVS
jgi:hypothetical protein